MHQANPDDQHSCFLCEPARKLVFFESPAFFALAGLGPVTDGYSVFATKEHVKSMADLPGLLRSQRDALVESVRGRLANRYSGCLITEHGRMAVCTEDSHDHDPHCYHAHFLIFPGAQDVSSAARSYFSKMQSFRELGSAMSHAANQGEY